MTGQYTLFFTLLAHDWSWVTWVRPQQAHVKTGPLMRALRVNSDQLKTYLTWLEEHGYLTVFKLKRGVIKITLTQLSAGFIKQLSPAASSQHRAAAGGPQRSPAASGQPGVAK